MCLTILLNLRSFTNCPRIMNKCLVINSSQLATIFGGCPGVPVHEGIPIVFITIHGVMTQFVNVSFFCVPVHEDTTHFWDSLSCYGLPCRP